MTTSKGPGNCPPSQLLAVLQESFAPPPTHLTSFAAEKTQRINILRWLNVVQASEKKLEQARLYLSYTKITAPMNGAIAEVNCELNENVQAGQQILLLTSGSQLEVNVSIPEVLISQIEEKKEVSVKYLIF